MNYTEIAKKYHECGLSVIPVNSDKIPIGSWKENSTIAIMPNGKFNDCPIIGICCGVNNVEAIDIDCKYDLSGQLFDNFKHEINLTQKGLLKKLVVQSTVNGGYHFIYRCKEIDGNKKLSNRHSIESERQKTYDKILAKELGKGTEKEIAEELAKKARENDKIRVLIETRGVGGYIAVSPSTGYNIIYGSLENIQEITPEERRILFDCARLFNEVTEPLKDDYKVKKQVLDVSPFDDFNERGDIISILENNGWSKTRERGNKLYFLRSGGDGKWSAEYDTIKKLFYVWTTSTCFTNDKAYNHSQVLAYLNFNQDYSETAKWLIKEGYGTKKEYEKPKEYKIIREEKPIIISEHIVPFDIDEPNILSYKNGTFELGLTTGIKTLDEFFRFKVGNFNCVNGHANVGKTIMIAYLTVLASFLHNWVWIIYSSENRTWSLRKKLMEFYMNTPITKMSDRQYEKARKWLNEHYIFIGVDRLYSAKELIDVADAIRAKQTVNGFLVDPYNSLRIDLSRNDKFSSHEYHYQVASEFRIFANSNGINTILNCHAVTEALRRKDKDGFPQAPYAEDTEGGGKFVNRADDFLTLHRLVQHPNVWMNTEIYVRKVKDNETGGRATPLDSPVILSMNAGGAGFTDETGVNPMASQSRQEEIPIEVIPTQNPLFWDKVDKNGLDHNGVDPNNPF